MTDTAELIARLTHLVSLNEHKNGGPYQGAAAAGYNDEHENEYDLRARQVAFATTLIDVQISLAMRPEYIRDGVKIGFLPPQHWPEVLRRLQATYRRATGEQHAILVVENGDAI